MILGAEWASLPGMPDFSGFYDRLATGLMPGSINFWAIVVGGVSVALCLALENCSKRLPATLMGIAGGALVYHLGIWLFSLPPGPEVGTVDLAVLFKVPALLDGGLDWSLLRDNLDIPLLAGLSIGLLCAFDTVLMAGALDMQTRRDSDANHDLRVHGLTNGLMGFLGFLPGSGTLGRSTTLLRSGAMRRAANIGAAIVLALMLLVLAPLVAVLPLWALSGMLLAGAVQAVDRGTLVKVRAVVCRRAPYSHILAGDVLITLGVVATAMIFDLIVAVGAGIVLSIVLFVVGMGRDPVRRTYSGAKVHSNVQRSLDHLMVLERDAARIAVIELQGGTVFWCLCASAQDRPPTHPLRGKGHHHRLSPFVVARQYRFLHPAGRQPDVR